MRYVFPADYGNCCYLVPIDRALVPLVAGALRLFEERGIWASEEDYEQGYNAFAELQGCMNGRCMADLVESNQQIYRLLDRALNGTAYVAVPDPVDPVLNPPTISPAIADVPPSTALAPGLLARFERLLKIEDNLTTGRTYGFDAQNPGEPLLDENNGVRHSIELMRGVIKPGWFGIGGQQATLVDVIGALRMGSEGDKDGLVDTIDLIVNGVDAGTDVVDVVKDFFTSGVEITGEAAILATLIASSIANAALLQTNNTLSLNILRAMRGLNPTPDNLLQALRGSEPSSSTRNVIDRLADLGDSEELLAKLDLVLEALRGPTPPADNILTAIRGDENASATRNVITVVS